MTIHRERYYGGKGQPAWLPWLIVFLAGLLLGWLVIGWWLWPVTYTNSLPQDLRVDYRDQYLTMVAESFNTNKDAGVARERTALWPATELAEHLSLLQTTANSSNRAQADNVGRLATALSVGKAAPAAKAGPGAATAAPTAVRSGEVPASAAATAPVPLWRRLLTGLIWLLVAGLGAAAIILLVRRWRQQQSLVPAPAGLDTRTHRNLRSPGNDQSAADIAQEARSSWPAEEYDQVAMGDQDPWPGLEDEPVGGNQASAPKESPVRRGASALSRATGALAGLKRREAPEPAAIPEYSVRELTPVGDFEAQFHAGELDYQQPFDINDPNGGFIGECGVTLKQPVGRNGDQAAALDVWLWETSDQDTRSLVLISEGALRDKNLMTELAEGREPVVVRPGEDFWLNSSKIAVHGKIEKVMYVPDEAPQTYFAEVRLSLRTYLKPDRPA